MNIINGPINNLKRVFGKSHTLTELQDSVKHFLDGFDLDLDADGNRFEIASWESDDDEAIRLLFGRMHDGVLADEIGCTIPALRQRAYQKGLCALLEEFDEDAVMMVKNLHNNGSTSEKIADIMGINPPISPYSYSREEKLNLMSKISDYERSKLRSVKYTTQPDAFED